MAKSKNIKILGATVSTPHEDDPDHYVTKVTRQIGQTVDTWIVSFSKHPDFNCWCAVREDGTIASNFESRTAALAWLQSTDSETVTVNRRANNRTNDSTR